MSDSARPRFSSSRLRSSWPWLFGLGAFLWVLLRSGANPRRLTYPCQRAAVPIAVSWLLAVGAFLAGSLVLKRFARFSGMAVLILGVFWFATAVPEIPWAQDRTLRSLPTWEVTDPISTVFVMDNVPPTAGSLAAGGASVPDEYLVDGAIDTLLMMMEEKDFHFYRTAEHPDGVVGSDNYVVIKGNFQWTSRNTTSTDRVKGVIWRILNHPDGFTGEILVVDNTQEIGTGVAHNDNNSEDTAQSIIDVVDTFFAKGYPVYALDWYYIWDDVAEEYSLGDYNDGYVYEEATKISYPKFQSPSGNYYVSLRYGIWDDISSTYDESKLCIIDFPVLKAHSWAGSTIAVKNWIGTLTTAHSTERYGGKTPMHNDYMFSEYALVARIMEATYPRLAIVDAAWTTTYGPANLTWVQETNWLAASTDPVAVSWYTAKHMLTPIARYPNQTNPDRPGGTYANILENWETYFRDTAGLACTADSLGMSVYDRAVLYGTGVGGGTAADVVGIQLEQNYPNPFNPTTVVPFTLNREQRLSVTVFDAGGREVRRLADRVFSAGRSELVWDGLDDAGRPVGSGVYLIRAEGPRGSQERKISLLK